MTAGPAPGLYRGAPLCCGSRSVDLSRPAVMGVLNITPDSFSDGGELYRNGRPDLDAVRRRAVAMAAAGAAIIDIGGESTRPGATPIAIDEELARVLPAVEAVVGECDVVVSVDTSVPQVMRAAVAAGAGMINDVRALSRDGALRAAAASTAAVCLMHMRGEPVTMQDNPVYRDVVTEVAAFLAARRDACIGAGIAATRIAVDPGFCFGKTGAHNRALLRRLDRFAAIGAPVLVGVSRKSLVAQLTGRPAGQRLAGSLALAVLALEGGAAILRVHDVAATVDVVNVLAGVLGDES